MLPPDPFDRLEMNYVAHLDGHSSLLHRANLDRCGPNRLRADARTTSSD